MRRVVVSMLLSLALLFLTDCTSLTSIGACRLDELWVPNGAGLVQRGRLLNRRGLISFRPMTEGTLQSQEMSILAPSGFRRVCAENKRLLLWNDAYPPTFSCQARDALHRICGGRTMASWVGAARKDRSLKELDVATFMISSSPCEPI